LQNKFQYTEATIAKALYAFLNSVEGRAAVPEKDALNFELLLDVESVLTGQNGSIQYAEYDRLLTAFQSRNQPTGGKFQLEVSAAIGTYLQIPWSEGARKQGALNAVNNRLHKFVEMRSPVHAYSQLCGMSDEDRLGKAEAYWNSPPTYPVDVGDHMYYYGWKEPMTSPASRGSSHASSSQSGFAYGPAPTSARRMCAHSG
jgi:hypothetical protein